MPSGKRGLAETKLTLRPRGRILGIAAVCAVALAYLWFIRIHTSPYAVASDASGYLNLARLLDHGELTPSVGHIEGLHPPDWDYYYQQPLGFTVDRQSGIMTPTYPVGLPLQLWLASRVVGLEYASMLLNVALAAASGWLMVGLGRALGLSWAWALAGAAVLWACPLFVLHNLQPMSDVPAMVWCMAAVLCALHSRERWGWGLAAGAGMAMAVLVRPSNLLLIVPLAAIFGLRWRTWAAFTAGGLPGALFLAWFNLQLYGTAFTTGYGDVRSAFSSEFVPHNTAHVLLWTLKLLSPAWAVALVGLVWLKRQVMGASLLLCWTAVFFGFYVFYYHTGETWWYLRFLLPVFPALILLGLFGARALLDRFAPANRRLAIAIPVLAATLLFQMHLSRDLHVTDVKHSDLLYVKLADWMRQHAPSDAIVLQMQTSGAFLFYTDFTVVRWDLPPPDAQHRLFAAARASGRPVYAALFDFEEKEAFAGRLTGDWREVIRIERAAIWQLSDAPPSR